MGNDWIDKLKARDAGSVPGFIGHNQDLLTAPAPPVDPLAWVKEGDVDLANVVHTADLATVVHTADLDTHVYKQSSIQDLPNALASLQTRMADPFTPTDASRKIRTIAKTDIRVSRDPTDHRGFLHRSLDGKTLLITAGRTECIWIDFRFPGYLDIASVAYYDNDASLAGGSTTPSTSPLATVTTAPFSLGGMSANGEMSPWLAAGLSGFGSSHTMSVLVTFNNGNQQVATATHLPVNGYVATFSSELTALGSGGSRTTAAGAYNFTGSNSTTRAALSTLTAGGNVIVDAVGASQASLSGSNCEFYGDFEWVGGILVRGDDYIFDGGTGRQLFTYPYWVAPGAEGVSRCLQIDGVGGTCHRPKVRHAMIKSSVSDLLNTSRAQDVLIEDVIFGDDWDLVSNSHCDGWQYSGLITASGNLLDAEGDAVAVLMKDCVFYGSAIIIKPDLGSGDPITLERVHTYNSARVGIQVQQASSVNTVTWVKFRRCTSNGHPTFDFLNTPSGSNYIPIKTKKGLVSGTPASDEGELQYGSPISSNVVYTPPELAQYPLSIRVGDIAKVATINGTSATISRGGVSGFGSTYLFYLLLNDETVTVTPPTGIRVVGSQALTGNGKFWVCALENYDGTYPGPYTFTFSATVQGTMFEDANTWAARGVEDLVFATPAAYTANATITAPSIVARGRNRHVKWIWGVAKTASADAWTKPIATNGGSILAATVATQINTVESSSLGTNAALLEAYRPQSYKTPPGAQGTLGASYNQSGVAFACAVVLGPSKEAPPIVAT